MNVKLTTKNAGAWRNDTYINFSAHFDSKGIILVVNGDSLLIQRVLTNKYQVRLDNKIVVYRGDYLLVSEYLKKHHRFIVSDMKKFLSNLEIVNEISEETILN